MKDQKSKLDFSACSKGILLCVVSCVFLFFLGVLPSAALASDLSDCELELQGDESLPSKFPVGKCLNAEGQRSRVPAKQPDTGPPTSEQQTSGILAVLVDAIDLLVKWIAALALVVFIIGALLTIISEGKEDRLEKGKTAMIYSLIGLAIALFSFVIVTFVQSILF